MPILNLKNMKIPFLTHREKSCIRFWNTKQNSDVIRTSFNLAHYLKVKAYRDGIEKN